MNIKTACFLLSLCHAAGAAAIGLGELNVRSNLGQPLHATVKLLGASPETNADCFSLVPSEGGIAAPPRVQFQLEQRDGQALLHLRTPQSLHEPVAQFTLVYACETRLQRDFVVLLDPPTPVVAPTATVAAPAAAAPTPAAAQPAVTANRRPATARRVASAGPRATARKPAPASPGGPRLVLSGKRHLAGAASTLALQLDTNLPDLNRAPPEGLTATELSDENTALTRKLAHLESQLAALQLRNAELEARRAAAPAAVPAAPPPAQARPQWPLYLLAVGLLTGGGALAFWLRRRGRQRANPFDDTPWLHHDKVEPLPEPPRMAHAGKPLAAPEPEPEPAAGTLPDVFEFHPPSRAESTEAGEGTEVSEDILDQAEVFMAHGHGDLAINLLQEHLREDPTESPVPWMLLLDLLHRAGDTEGYAAASAECRRHFNVNLSTHPVSQDSAPTEGLEAYPHVLEQLVQVWNSPQVDDFFKELIYDTRGGTRVGFEAGAYRDILLLRAVAQDALPLAA